MSRAGLPGDDSDEQARWIEATVTGDRGAVRLCGLYLPNGNPAPGPKYDYKLAWMARMRAHAAGYWKRRCRWCWRATTT
jgi:exodeoxyribonuclease-3